MDFVLVLHSHLPYVLNHGRWPHGSDWLCEAAVDTYLPLYKHLCALVERRIPVPITLGITPVLANQLASREFNTELERFLEQRLEHCREAAPSLQSSDPELVPLVRFWESHLNRLRDLFRSIDGNLVTAFRRLEEQGVIELISSAATHGFLPLLGTDESIRLQLTVGRAEHRRLFGSTPQGCWLPECAYRPRGRWDPLPGARPARMRAGIEEFLSAQGYRYFITDAHMAHAGTPLDDYDESLPGGEHFHARPRRVSISSSGLPERSPYRAYRVTPASLKRAVAALVRDPKSSKQVWSRQQGYPGDGAYLEFHKIRWPHGLKLWRVTGSNVDLGGKQPYQPDLAREKAGQHAGHFAYVLNEIARSERQRDGVIVAPFDTELLGHWWFEGVDFMAALYERLHESRTVVGGRSSVVGKKTRTPNTEHRTPLLRPVTGSQHLAEHRPTRAIRLASGSWGARGDYSMWMNPDTEWTWRRLWPLEDRFWRLVPKALATDGAHPVLAQAARELLLAQSSDWQFIISTGVVRDYGERRFVLHCEELEQLLDALEHDLERGQRMAETLFRRDHLFPDVLDSVAAATGRRAARASRAR